MRPSERGAVIGLLLTTACATGRAPSMAATPSSVESDTVRLTAHRVAAAAPGRPDPRELVLRDAEALIGTRYRYGGSSPDAGFDCSGFVHWVFSRHGVDLPRTSRAIARSGVRVAARRTVLLPGDLLFFAEKGASISHVAIYAGDGRIIHASSGQGEVRYDDLDSARGQWFRRHVVLARRMAILDPGQRPFAPR